MVHIGCLDRFEIQGFIPYLFVKLLFAPNVLVEYMKSNTCFLQLDACDTEMGTNAYKKPIITILTIFSSELI